MLLYHYISENAIDAFGDAYEYFMGMFMARPYRHKQVLNDRKMSIMRAICLTNGLFYAIIHLVHFVPRRRFLPNADVIIIKNWDYQQIIVNYIEDNGIRSNKTKWRWVITSYGSCWLTSRWKVSSAKKAGISSSSLVKLTKDENVTTEVLSKIC